MAASICARAAGGMLSICFCSCAIAPDICSAELVDVGLRHLAVGFPVLVDDGHDLLGAVEDHDLLAAGHARRLGAHPVGVDLDLVGLRRSAVRHLLNDQQAISGLRCAGHQTRRGRDRDRSPLQTHASSKRKHYAVFRGLSPRAGPPSGRRARRDVQECNRPPSSPRRRPRSPPRGSPDREGSRRTAGPGAASPRAARA